AVEDKALAAKLLDPALDHRDHDVVRHQLAGVHDRLRLLAQGRAGRALRAEHVAGGKLNHAVTLFEPLGLSPLPGTGWAEQKDVHPRLPLSLDFLIKPSY